MERETLTFEEARHDLPAEFFRVADTKSLSRGRPADYLRVFGLEDLEQPESKRLPRSTLAEALLLVRGLLLPVRSSWLRFVF